MKKQIIIISLAVSLFSLVGCSGDKCSHCMIKDSQGAVIKDYDEKCGKSKDVSDYEKSCQEDAVQYGGTFDCTSK